MPGAGHIVHMPSHIYWRVGRYADAVSANTAALKADRGYFALAQPSPIYRGLYHPHNIDFIWQSDAMQGRSADTLKDARKEAKYMLSDDYRRASEASAKLATVQIWKGSELIAEMEG